MEATTPPEAHPNPQARQYFYDYLAHRAGEGISYQTLAGAAAQIFHELNPVASVVKLASSMAYRLLADPLLRTGVLSFRGSGTYGLSATVAVPGVLSSVVVFNAPFGKTLPNAEYLTPGVIRLPHQSVPEEIPFAQFDALAQLRSMPAIAQIIEGSPDWAKLIRGTPRGGWEVLRRHGGWGAQRPDEPRDHVSLYRENASTVAPHYLWIGEQSYRVPARSVNPSGILLAHLLRDSSPDGPPSTFRIAEDEFVVTSSLFPPEVERALWLAEVTLNGIAVDTCAECRSYRLATPILSELNRILLRDV